MKKLTKMVSLLLAVIILQSMFITTSTSVLAALAVYTTVVEELPDNWNPTQYTYTVVGDRGLLGSSAWQPENDDFNMNYDANAGIWYLNLNGVANKGEKLWYGCEYKVVVRDWNLNDPWAFAFNENGVTYGYDSNSRVDFGEVAEKADVVTILFDGYRTYSRIDQPYTPTNDVVKKDYYTYNGHIYQLIDKGLTWNEAKDYCEIRGGHLVTITSSEEQQFIESILQDTGKNSYWLGATDEETEGLWQWITGEEWDYVYWDVGEGQPDNYNSDEHYLQIQSNYRWNDAANDNRYESLSYHSRIDNMGFICEWDYEDVSFSSSYDIFVMMERNNHDYDLLKETQTFIENSNEKVTINVFVDWKNHKKGTIALTQNDEIKLQNQGSSFVDICPAKIFDTNQSVFMVLKDEKGNVICKRKLLLVVTDSAISRNIIDALSNDRISVYQNYKGKDKIIENAEIEYNGKKYFTNSAGVAILPNVVSDAITVSKQNFVTRVISAEQLKDSKTVYLEPKNDEAPVISAVWIDNIDVLRQSYSLEMLSQDKITIKAEIDWGKYSYGNVCLYQNGKKANFNGDTLSTVISEQFDTSDTITIIATDSQKHSTEKTLMIENETVNNIVKKLNGMSFDFSDELKMTLPDSIPIFGGMDVGAGVTSKIPVTISVDKGKIYAAIGVDIASIKKSTTKITNKNTGYTGVVKDSPEIKTFIKDFKDIWKGNLASTDEAKKSLKKLKNLKQVYKDAMKRPQGKFGVEAKFTVLGFAEGAFDESGSINWVDNGIILQPSVSVDKTIPCPLEPFPLYFKIGCSADVIAQFNLIVDEQAKKFLPDGEISGTISFNGGLGVGLNKVLYAEGGIEGSLIPDWKINYGSKDHFTLKGNLKAYAKAGIAFFEAEKKWDLAKKTLIEYPSKKSTKTLESMMGDYDFYDFSNYTVKDLSYLNETQTDKNINDKTSKLISESSQNSYIDTVQLKTNIYKEATPQYVSFDDGTKLAVWLDSKDSNIDNICLYYSFFNGNKWSNPAIIYKDGTMDYAPNISKSNGKVYLAWQNATRTFKNDKNPTLESIAKDFDISVAVFNKSSLTFDVHTFKTDTLDMQSVIYANGDDSYVAWVNNSENNWFGNNQKNNIFFSKYEKGEWSTPKICYSNLNSVNSLAIDYNDKIKIAYCVDTDGDISTTDDLRIYENGILINNETASAPTYHNHRLYWYSNNTILSGNIQQSENQYITSDKYQLIDIDDTIAAVFYKGNGLYSSIDISYFNTETNSWESPKTLIDDNSFIGSFFADVTKEGNIEILASSCNVTGSYDDEQPYGTASLVFYGSSKYCDISIDDVLYDESSFCANSSMHFDLNIVNQGLSSINGFDIVIKDENNNILSTTYKEDQIVPGQIIETSVSYTVLKKSVSQNIVISVIPKNASDVDLSNNTQNITLSYENVSVENLTWAVNNNSQNIISADIVNYGYKKATNVLVKLVKDRIDGEVIATKNITSINSLSMQTVFFELNDNDKNIYFVCIENETDEYSGDNSDYILINRDKVNLLGDVNKDGNINVADALIISRYDVGLTELDGSQLAVGDVNGDGSVTVADALIISRYDVGLIDSF